MNGFQLLDEFLGDLIPLPQPRRPHTQLRDVHPYPDHILIPLAKEPSPYKLKDSDAPSEVVRRLLLAYEKAYQRFQGEVCPPVSARPERYKAFEKLYEFGLWLHAQQIAPYFWAMSGFLRYTEMMRKVARTKRVESMSVPKITWVFAMSTTKDEKRLEWALECAKKWPGRREIMSTTHRQIQLDWLTVEDQLLRGDPDDADAIIERMFSSVEVYERRVLSARSHNEFIERAWAGCEARGQLTDPSQW